MVTVIKENPVMDDERFDALLRTLTAGSSRRGLLARLASGLVALLPLMVASERADGKKRKDTITPATSGVALTAVFASMLTQLRRKDLRC